MWPRRPYVVLNYTDILKLYEPEVLGDVLLGCAGRPGPMVLAGLGERAVAGGFRSDSSEGFALSFTLPLTASGSFFGASTGFSLWMEIFSIPTLTTREQDDINVVSDLRLGSRQIKYDLPIA